MYTIGIDIGGTFVKLGIVDESGNIIKNKKYPTQANQDNEYIISKMISEIENLILDSGLNKKQILGIGIACAGLIDSKAGVILYSNNFKWENFPIKDILNERLRLPVRIANDAQCAVLGEIKKGNAQNCKDVILITLGTGIGSGITVNGKLLRQSQGGGIAGHTIIQKNGRLCSCGKKGCLEAYCSTSSLIKITKNIVNRNKTSILYNLCNKNIDSITGEMIFEALAKNDEIVRNIIDEYLENLSIGISNLINIFRPEKILISGGVSNQGDILLIPLKEKVYGKCFASNILPQTDIQIAKLKNDAGIIGATELFNMEE